MKRLRLVVLGTFASDAFAGMAWMTMQIASGLKRLGHDVYYFETTSDWPYDPGRRSKTCDSDYAVPYLARVAERFGLGDSWAYRRSYSDKEWLGMPKSRALDLLANADAVFNVAGATRVAQEELQVGRLVLYGTDPVYRELAYAQGDPETIDVVDEHHDVVTYGENIGQRECIIPPLPRQKATTRQPVLMDMWHSTAPARKEFTTVCNWLQTGREVAFQGELYQWSKHHEFVKVMELPRRVAQPLELATNIEEPDPAWQGKGATVAAFAMPDDSRSLLEGNGWSLTNASEFTTDPWRYRDYICESAGEFTVARDLNVRLRSGWFSERSACYLAAGKPVVTQNTGFSRVLPVGEGLFAFDDIDEAQNALDEIAGDYEKHSKAARAIAREYFDSNVVLGKLLSDLNL